MTDKIALACPVCKAALNGSYACVVCGTAYPLAGGIPILLNDKASVFRTADYLDAARSYGGASDYAGSLDKRSGPRQWYRRAMARLLESRPPKLAYSSRMAVDDIRATRPHAKILVIGAGDASLGTDGIFYTDVAFGKDVMCIADAHDLPFLDHTFDACIACAVLEHVVDPYRCVAEIVRILKPGGYVYAETPFMQPVHMRQHDFTRFSFLGHRRLLRHFDDVKSGVAGGPGVSAAQMMRYAIASLSDRPVLRKWLKLWAVLVTYPVRWLDYLSFSSPSAYDSASGFYFLGTLRQTPITDQELLASYRGS